MCDVLVFFRRGREKETRRTKTVQAKDRPERASEGQWDRTQQSSISLCSGLSILFSSLVLGARILSFRHNYCQCVELLYG